jgi:hypothetical protein
MIKNATIRNEIAPMNMSEVTANPTGLSDTKYPIEKNTQNNPMIMNNAVIYPVYHLM